MKTSAKNTTYILSAILIGIFIPSALCNSFYLNIFNNGGYNGDPNFVFSVDVTNPGSNQIDFKIKNDSVLDSIITQVLFDDGQWLDTIAGIIEGAGTDFKNPAGSEVLPGGNLLTPSFITSAGLSADREKAGGVSNGIDPNEFIIITFDLLPGKTFDQVIDALENGDMRIGTHVQSLPKRDGFSDSASAVTPEPTTIMFLAAGLLGLRRRLIK